MKLFQRETDDAEKLFILFDSSLKRKGFDLKVFDKRLIKKYLGRGLYEGWKKSLEELHYRKLIIVFIAKEPRVSWPSDMYPDWLVINIARAPDKEAILKAEKELLGLLELDKELS